MPSTTCTGRFCARPARYFGSRRFGNERMPRHGVHNAFGTAPKLQDAIRNSRINSIECGAILIEIIE